MTSGSHKEVTRAWVRLAHEEALSTADALRLAAIFGGPDALYKQPPAALRAVMPETLAESIAAPPGDRTAECIEIALEWSRRPGHALLHPQHDEYPVPLLECTGHPLLLYAQGNLARLRHDALAIVGARNATPDGADHARGFARNLAASGLCIVSGLARGIDAAAHLGALEAGCEGAGTIAVLGTGADIVYPRVNAALHERILSQQGLIVTDLPLGSPPLAFNFPRRNRIVAGLARGVLVVEAALRSGSLITARLSTEFGREVFALPGSIHSPLSRGPHALIQQGAKLVEQASDILGELSGLRFGPTVLSNVNVQSTDRAPASAKPVPGETMARPQASPLWPAIGYDPVSEDTLQRRSGLLPAILQAELLTLELAGHIRRNPDGRVSRARR